MVTGFIVRPMSIEDITKAARRIRKYIGISEYLDICKFLDMLALRDVVTYDIIDYDSFIQNWGHNILAFVDTSRCTIVIREDIFREAEKGNARSRFTLAHELGHYIFHLNQPTLMRYSSDPRREIFRDSEWQANYFAGCLLAPQSLLNESMSIEEIMRNFGISRKAAEVRYKQVFKNKK